MEVLAHYDQKSKDGEPLIEHLLLVAKRAAEFASAFSQYNEAYVAGLLHDLGKWGDAFQRRLKGELNRVDHWSIGAWQALQQYKENGVAIALAIDGHHIGLQQANKDYLQGLNPNDLQTKHPLGLTLSSATVDRLFAEGINLKDAVTTIYRWGMNNTSSMLDIRMLFSALVDADFLETEAWFNRDGYGRRRYRPSAPELTPEKALSALQEHVKELASTKKGASLEMKELRNRLFSVCLQAGHYKPGLFTLTAPTGSGKTLAMLAFALVHAMKHNLRRIVVVLPYLTLIEQTALVYREVFRKFLSDDEMVRYICEDHSLSGSGIDGHNTTASADTTIEKLLSENWDAPIIITTNVQFLESLFSNRPMACRKLHRLARSVILFDEVQTLPLNLVIPTLGALSRLAEKYGTTVVFATATQPAFSHLNDQVKEQCALGWQPREIVPDPSQLFHILKPKKIVFLNTEKPVELDEIAERLADEEKVLCILNTKRQAKQLFQMVKAKRGNVFHLSTNMCPAHRLATLARVRSLLDNGKPCCLVSTQCVEAGVDIDFPVVFRSLAPLDAIAQAAGRCNRHSLLTSGKVYIFRPTNEAYPDNAYQQATDVAVSLLNAQTDKELDTADLNLFEQYYRRLYSVRGISHQNANTDPLLEAIKEQDFVEVSRLYRVIPQYTINVLVPYDKAQYHSLAKEVRQNGLTYHWLVRARYHSVSLFRPRSPQDDWYQCLEQIRVKPDHDEESTEWFIYRKEEDYDLDTGLNISPYPLDTGLNISPYPEVIIA